MTKIKNELVKIEDTYELNDRDILNEILETEKNMSNNLSIALNEMSNSVLYDKVFDVFKNSKTIARNSYNILFKNGWYVLECESETKIDSVYKEFFSKLKSISLVDDE